MTNEIVAAGAAVNQSLTTAFGQHLGHEQEAVNQFFAWFAEKAPAFAFNLVSALVILVLGWIATKVVVAAVGKAMAHGREKNALLVGFVRNATSKVCWAVLLVVVLGKLGVDIAPIIAGLGVTGFILGFAFQESLGNLASGLMIAINEPFKIGDYVIVAGNEGTVLKVDMMATVLATADNKKVIIPNKSAWGGPITNFSALGQRRVDLQVAVAYSADVAAAIRVALDALKSVPGVLADPQPAVAVAALSDGRVTLNVRPWVDGAKYWDVFNDAQIAVKNALEKNGVAAAVPHLVVHQA
jgi:small conductance mechanosensitive channel